MKFTLYAAEIKFAQAVNNALVHHVSFQIYRTFEGKVQKCEIRMLDVNVMTGEISIDFKFGEEIKFEKATKQDLMLISQRARQLEAARK